MTLFLAGLAIFLAAHCLPMFKTLRDGIAAQLGRPTYMIAYSIVSLAGFIMMAVGYDAVRTQGDFNPQLWEPPTWSKHIAFLLMLPAMVALVAAYVPSRIRDILRHPMLVAIKIWALAHLIANGDLISVILFGSFLAYAVVDRISLKRRDARGPLGNRTGGIIGDVVVVLAGLAAYAFMLFHGHDWLIGVGLIAA